MVENGDVVEPETEEYPLTQEDASRQGEERSPRQVTLSPRSVWLLAALVVGNLIVLILLGVALYRTSTELTQRPPHVTVVLTPTPGSSPTPGPTPTPFGRGGAIAFTLRQDGNADIYAINQLSREVVRLTSDLAEDRDPAWSPDSEMLAFSSRRAGNWDVYLLDLVGGALIRVTRDTEFDGHPTWSPDSQRIALASYRHNNLDIYLMDIDGRNVERLTTAREPDYAPVWSPDGSAIAFVSYRDGNQDIYLYIVEGEYAGEVVNVTNSPNVDETDPAWSFDGAQLAYTIGQAGYSKAQISTLEWQTEGITETQPVVHLSSTDLFGSGAAPTWAPDGQSVATVYETEARSYLIASSLYGWGLSQEIFSTEGEISDPTWSPEALSERAIVRARSVEPAEDPPLYTELVQPIAASPPYTLTFLADVNGSDERALLSDRVDNSFEALRRRVEEETGYDYLSILGSAWRTMDHTPRPGQSRRSWHVCGRAFDVNQAYYDQDDQRIQLVREDIGNETYWRVYIKAARQDGTMGEPLRVAPWDLKAREDEGLPAVQGGEPTEPIPRGYYVDFTTLAADYGWERVAALYRWRYYWPDIEWWHFQKTDDINWWDCMLEIYPPEQIEASFGPIPGRESELSD
jgi:TolB protein